jgi:DNA-binding LacI/PurR family transcriptional regulator
MAKSRQITIKDVAARSGVAISTVSRVINDRGLVSPETRERVQKAAHDLGYVRNSMAASMKSGNSNMIVVIIPDLVNDFFSAVVQGVEEVVSAYGYSTLFFTTGESPEKEKKFFMGELGNLVDGAVLIPSIDDFNFYYSLKKNVVLVDRTLGSLDSVVIDNYRGAFLATEELLRAGHKKIGIINGDRGRDFTICTNRMDGYLAAMKQYQVPVQDSYVLYGPWYQESGYELTRQLMELPDPPTAIFAANNQISIGCMNYLIEHDIQIGRDISLVAFDDSLLARTITPKVTVIERPTIDMGRIAGQILMDNLKGNGSCGQKRHMMDVKLIRRNSVVRLNEKTGESGKSS